MQGTLQGGQITLTNPAALTFNLPESTPAPVAPATPASTGTPSASSLAGVAVRLGNTAAMTGLGAGAIPAIPGFTPAPPMAPLPGYSTPNLNLTPLTGIPIPDQPAMPISTGSPLPDVNLGNWQEAFPISDPVLPNVVMATSPDVQAAQKGYPGVGVTPNGGPTFAGTDYLYPVDGNQKNIVSIPLTGSRRGDFQAANAAAGLAEVIPPGGETPSGCTWHHVDDYNPDTGMSTMELVSRRAHTATYPHSGSVAQFEKATGQSYRR